jgi:lysozyme
MGRIVQKCVCILAVAIVTIVATGCISATTPSASPLAPRIFIDQLTRSQYVLRSRRGIYLPGLVLTKSAEGFRSQPYNDAAFFCTIGYGHLIQTSRCDDSIPEPFRTGITEPAAGALLVTDMQLAEAAVQNLSPVTLANGQYAALCDFVYNVGARAYENSSLRDAVNDGRTEEVPTELRRWILAGGKVQLGLKKRRESEIKLFFDGLPEPRGGRVPLGHEVLIDIQAGEVK